MDRIQFASSLAFFLLVNCCLHAQLNDTLSARTIIEKGANGDIVAGKQNKKNTLMDTPVVIRSTDLLRKKGVASPAKKYRRKKL